MQWIDGVKKPEQPEKYLKSDAALKGKHFAPSTIVRPPDSAHMSGDRRRPYVPRASGEMMP